MGQAVVADPSPNFSVLLTNIVSKCAIVFTIGLFSSGMLV